MKLASTALFDDSLSDAAPLGPFRDVEFIEMPVRTILNRCENPRMPFRWTINPYRGCEFGCVYCYARYTHEFLELRDPMDFERRIFVKRMAAQVLSHTLSRTPHRLGPDRDRHGDRPLSAGRAQVRTHAFDARGVRATGRARSFDHDQVRAGGARPRPAKRDQLALEAQRQLLADDAQPPPSAHARAARAAPGIAPACAGAS